MGNLVQSLSDKGLISPPRWLPTNVQYVAITGSRAYGVASPDKSDWDVYAWAIPPKASVFPHLTGAIAGFGTQPEPFHKPFEFGAVNDPEAERGKGAEYDLTVYNVVRYFDLCLGCNPNMIDSLFVPEECVLHATKVADLVRDRRALFLSRKAVWGAFKGYAKSQVTKLRSKIAEGKRKEAVEREGFDRKFAYHAVRLLDEAHQILTEHTIDLRRQAELLKHIRADGGMPLDEILAWVDESQTQLQIAYEQSTLREQPAEAEVLQLLYDCLEHHFGSLEAAQPRPDRALTTLRMIRQAIDESGLPV